MLIVVVDAILVGLPDHVALQLFLVRRVPFTVCLCEQGSVKLQTLTAKTGTVLGGRS